MGFLKYLLLLVVKVILTLIAALLLTLIFSALSHVKFFEKVFMITLTTGLGAYAAHIGPYYVCHLLAEKLNAYKPFKAVCITGMVAAVISGVLSVVSGDSCTADIVAFSVSMYVLCEGS